MSRVTIGEAFAMAARHHQAGQLREAEDVYRQILQAAPEHFDATQLLGLVCYQTGRYDEALALLRRAVAQNGSAWGPRCNLALTLLELGKLEEAAREADAALAINPHAADGLFVRAAVMYQTGRTAESLPIWRRILELNPNHVAAWASLGAACERLGQLEEALTACRRAVELDATSPYSLVTLGSVLTKLGRFDEAAQMYRQALALAPAHVAALVNLSFATYNAGRHDDSAAAARRAIELEPGNPDARRNLAAALQELGAVDDAVREMHSAAELFQRRGRPGDSNRANHLRLAAATSLPVMYESIDELTRSRRHLIEYVATLRRENVTLDVSDEHPSTVFTLAYHGQNDRDVMKSLAELIVAPASPPLVPQPLRGRKIRVGFVSRFLRDHTIGRLNLGLISHLSRERFDVTVLKLIDESDPVVERLRASSDRFVVLPPILQRAREMIREQSLDVLFYTDIGMEPLAYALGFSRLAPVQCVTWGHPVTSGISTIDYFISAAAMEPPGSEHHYTERLVRLASPAVYYYRPTLPPNPKTRADFGLPDDATIYGCLQMPFKLHPEFDELLGGVLRRDPRAVVLLLQGRSALWTEKLVTRLRHNIGDLVDRIRFIPPLPYDDFLTLTSVCDVMLDPIHFGGGNTVYEAFAFGVPVITWPSTLARGRIAYALYQLMGIDDCIAPSREQYSELAASIGADAQRRGTISEKILAAHPALFENPAGVRELEAFFVHAVNEACARA